MKTSKITLRFKKRFLHQIGRSPLGLKVIVELAISNQQEVSPA